MRRHQQRAEPLQVATRPPPPVSCELDPNREQSSDGGPLERTAGWVQGEEGRWWAHLCRPQATVWSERPGKLLTPAAARGLARRHAQQFVLSGTLRGSCARLRAAALGLEDMHGPHHVLPADGTLAHPLPTFGAGDHVTTLQQHAVDDGVHADAAEVFVRHQLRFDAICGRRRPLRG